MKGVWKDFEDLLNYVEGGYAMMCKKNGERKWESWGF